LVFQDGSWLQISLGALALVVGVIMTLVNCDFSNASPKSIGASLGLDQPAFFGLSQLEVIIILVLLLLLGCVASFVIILLTSQA
jgi:hypothetical protein